MSSDAALTHLVGAAAIILVAANGAGWLARRLGQPSITTLLTQPLLALVNRARPTAIQGARATTDAETAAAADCR
jgi:hypothetical protein